MILFHTVGQYYTNSELARLIDEQKINLQVFFVLKNYKIE